jgi:hypothetical protein
MLKPYKSVSFGLKLPARWIAGCFVAMLVLVQGYAAAKPGVMGSPPQVEKSKEERKAKSDWQKSAESGVPQGEAAERDKLERKKATKGGELGPERKKATKGGALGPEVMSDKTKMSTKSGMPQQGEAADKIKMQSKSGGAPPQSQMQMQQQQMQQQQMQREQMLQKKM